jgi:hypothetical protein
VTLVGSVGVEVNGPSWSDGLVEWMAVHVLFSRLVNTSYSFSMLSSWNLDSRVLNSWAWGSSVDLRSLINTNFLWVCLNRINCGVSVWLNWLSLNGTILQLVCIWVLSGVVSMNVGV